MEEGSDWSRWFAENTFDSDAHFDDNDVLSDSAEERCLEETNVFNLTPDWSFWASDNSFTLDKLFEPEEAVEEGEEQESASARSERSLRENTGDNDGTLRLLEERRREVAALLRKLDGRQVIIIS